MPRRMRLIILCITFFAVLFSLVPRLMASRLPGDHTGYAPRQPIAYSHRLHAGELAIPCMYCHAAAERSRHAGIPAANICMNCHRFVANTMGAVRVEEKLAESEGRKPRPLVSPEIQKLYDALALTPKMKRDPKKQPTPIAWALIHRLPDFAYFDHRAHVGAGVDCQKCHGPVQSMERVRQFNNLSMGWCVNCHRDARAHGIKGRRVAPSLDCAACHF
jgi:Cytochrome c7 and related cytochrome c